MIDGKTALRIEHLIYWMPKDIPDSMGYLGRAYTILLWNGSQWTITKQYSTDVAQPDHIINIE